MKKLLVAAAVVAMGICAFANPDVVEGVSMERMLEVTTAESFTGSTGLTLGYRKYVPAEVTEGEKLPLVVLMHGLGEIGTNNVRQLVNGGPQLLAYIANQGHKAVFIAPQCPSGHLWMECKPWQMYPWKLQDQVATPIATALELIEKTIKDEPVDPSRVYVTGMSMGGFATWELITRRPDLFACAVPICSGGDPAQAAKLKDLPIWTTHCADDGVVKPEFNRDMVKGFWDIKARNIRYTEFWKGGHNAWTPTLSDRAVLNWMFAQKKPEPKAEQPQSK